MNCSKGTVELKQTWGNKIRSMSDEELAKWLTKITDDAQLDAETKCDYQWAEWLQSEMEQQVASKLQTHENIRKHTENISVRLLLASYKQVKQEEIR